MSTQIYEISQAMQDLFEKRKKIVDDDGKLKIGSKSLDALEIGKSYFILNVDCIQPNDLEQALKNYRTICSRYSKDGKAFGAIRHETGFEIGRFS